MLENCRQGKGTLTPQTSPLPRICPTFLCAANLSCKRSPRYAPTTLQFSTSPSSLMTCWTSYAAAHATGCPCHV